MPEVTRTAADRPKAIIFVHVQVPARPSKQLVKTMTALAGGGMRLDGVPDGQVEVVAVSHLCATYNGRRRLLLSLRGAGLSGVFAHRLGWAVTVPPDAVEVDADGKRVAPRVVSVKSPVTVPVTPKPEMAFAPEAVEDDEKPIRRRSRRST